MESKEKIEQFCGIDIYKWEGWDVMDIDNFYFYNVEFLLPSMKQYNGMDVSQWFNGKIEIYGDENAERVVWSGYVTDIKEVIEELNRRI